MHEVRRPQPHALASGEDGEEAAVGVEVRELVVAPTCTRFRAQILSLRAATRGLAGGFKGAGATAQEEGKRPGPWLWQWSAAAAEGGRRVNRLEGTASRVAAVGVSRARPARRAAPRPG